MIRFFLSFVFILNLTSCNAVQFITDAQTEIDESMFGPKLTIADLNVDGTSWQTACLNNGSFDYYINVTFTATTVDSNAYIHTLSSNCGSATLYQDYRNSTYEYDDYDTYINPSIRDITVFDASYVAAFNSNTECGIGSWTASTAYSVLGVANCLGATRTNGTIVKQAYRVIDNDTVVLDGQTYYRQ